MILDPAFEADPEPFEPSETVGDEEALILDLDGYEGPLDLLLTLARKNKVDLGQISILELADQYIAFIQEARRKRLDVAAEYLVMAAWLAYLKSRLLLPKPRPETDEPEPETLAAGVAFRLLRLDAMRAAGAALLARPQFKAGVYPRGAPEGVRAVTEPVYQDTLFDLLRAYAGVREKEALSQYAPEPPAAYPLETARLVLSERVKAAPDWTMFDRLLPAEAAQGAGAPPPASVVASSMLAALEIAKEGEADMRQGAPYGTLFLRARRTL